VEEWEELLHHGSLGQMYPTFTHNASLIAHFLPLYRQEGGQTGKNTRSEACLAVGGPHATGGAKLHGEVQSAEL
jgi:hypothetical protein